MAVADDLNTAIAGRYQLQSKLGQGGMGSAYRAFDRATGRIVAVKRLDDSSANAAALFEREFHTLASLKHPCVIEVYDFGIAEDGRRYYTMELLEGDDISKLSPLPWSAVCAHLRDVATSLALLHARRLVHRDVSPRNVRIDPHGRAKLIDFGTVTPFGRATDIAGTPPCIAPEVLRGLELDARADLFSLGVVGYSALTNRRPYDVLRLHQAESAWRVKPRPIRELASDVPAALDKLVLSLLSIDPLGRPGSAAELIERLVAIADLDDEPLEGLTQSHLSSCALIGREREVAQCTQHFERAQRGQGAVVLIEGAAGMGRSRLSAEVTIQASLLGFASLRVDAGEFHEPGGLVVGIVRALTAAAPAEAAEMLPGHAALFQAFDQLSAFAIAPVLREPLPRDPLEQRALVHDALAGWLVDVAARRPLVIAVDNAHEADLASASALIAIAHASQHARVVFIATVLRGASSAIAVQQLARIGSRIRLRELPSEALIGLMRSVFGDVPHLSRLTSWIESVSGGVPGQALELLSGLTELGIIRYAGGTWVLPAELSHADLPQSLDDALAARLSQLTPNATRLARLLALHHAPAPLTLCQRVLPELSPSDLFDAIDQLVRQQVLVCSHDSYRIRHDALRKLLKRNLDESQIAEAHRVLGRAVLAGLPPIAMDDRRRAESVHDLSLGLQAGWHLLHAGEGTRARQILRYAGMELSHRGEGFADAIPPLQAALDEYERIGLSRCERGPLMIPLALAGIYRDWRLANRYGEPCIDLYSEATGLQLAQRLRRFLGRTLALWVSLGYSFIASLFPPRRSLARGYREIILGLIAVASAVIANASSLAEHERAYAVVRRLEPLGWFPRRHLLRLVYEFYRALADTAAGDYTRALPRARAVLAQLQAPIPGLPPDAHRQLEAGVLLCVGSLEVFRTDGSVHRTFEALARIESWSARPNVAGIRVNYHAGRGERAHYERFREELDVLAAQSGSTWRQDVLMPRNDWWSAALCEDVLGLKRAARKLEHIASEHPTLASTRDAAHACYLLERGRAQQALARYGAVLEREALNPTVYRMRFVATYARVLRAVGQPKQARRVCEAALASVSSADREFTLLVHFAEVELALALADLGERERAEVELDRLIDAQSHHDNALIHGLTHRARAQVALAAGDGEGFTRHLTAMQEWFTRTANPMLIAQQQRLAEEGRRAGLVGVTSTAPPARVDRHADQLRRAFAERRGPAERLQLAVDLLTERSGAAAGYLYLLEPRGLRFVAPMIGDEPPAALQRELAERIAQHGVVPSRSTDEASASPGELKTVVEADDDRAVCEARPGAAYSFLLLTLQRHGRLVIVGAVALAPGEDPLAPVSQTYLEEVARGIYDAGDVQTVYFEAKNERAG